MNKEQAIAYLRSNRPTAGFPGLAEAVDIGIAAIEESIKRTQDRINRGVEGAHKA